jgi:uncharacterized protein (TIGR00299 family) protein
MKRSVIFDIEFGASGDMLLGSLIDLGLDVSRLSGALGAMPLRGWKINPAKAVRYAVSGTLAGVSCEEDCEERNLGEISAVIRESGFHPGVRDNILRVFQRLAEAEATVHGSSVEKVHFHEVGAMDSIIDIAGFCAGLEILGIDQCYFTEFSFGSGTVQSRHGELPVPVPAVVELTRGFRSKLSGRQGELVTPTAAAILTTLARQVEHPTSYTLKKTGIGFGTRNYSFPSYTRALLADIDDTDASGVYQLECNIDDMNPQVYPYLIEVLFSKGALDAYITPIHMKKGRPGHLVTVIVPGEHLEAVRKAVYTETTTLGLRIFSLTREKLDRGMETVTVHGREIRIKTGFMGSRVVNVQPEFEDCRSVSTETGLPLKTIIQLAVDEYFKRHNR